MIEFIMFSLATIGLTNILVHGKIMDVIELRPYLKKVLPSKYHDIFECYECCGFWSGMLVGFIINPLPMIHPLLMVPICGFAGSVLSQTFTDLIYLLRSKTSFEIGDDDEPDS